MANVLNEEKKQQVLALGRLGWSLRRIQQATRIRRETASAHLKAAGIAVRPPSGWGRCEPKPANEVITDSGAAKPTIPVVPDARNPKPNPNPENLSNKGTARATLKPANENEVITDSAVVPGSSACEPYREAIELGISRGRNARAIWQDLVSEYGFASSYQSVQRFVRKRRGTQTPEARVVIVTAPGQEAQVDYGTGPMVRDPESRKYRRTRLFVMTLGCSRKSVRLLTFRSSSRIWAELHERAFRRLGGATRIVVLDNLREGVLVPDIYDPALNPLYRDVLAHYGAVAMPCRIQDPDRKGKVESGVGYAQKTPLKGLRFETLEEAQAYLDHWEQRWADTRIHAPPNGRWPPCLPKRNPRCCRCRWNRFATTSTASASCIWMAASKSKPPTTARRRAGSVVCFECNGMSCMFACSIPRPGNCSANTCARSAAGIALKKRTTPSEHHCALPNCCGEPVVPDRTSARSARPSTANKEKSACAASWAFYPWPRSTAQRPPMKPAPLRSTWVCRNTVSSASLCIAGEEP